MTEKKTIFVLGNVNIEQIRTQLGLKAKFVMNYNHEDALKATHELHKRGWPIDAVIIALRTSKPKEPISPKNPEEFVSRVMAEFGNLCPILVVSNVGYQRLPFADKGPILCHPDQLAQELSKALR
ncbi:hypothetical protein KKC63_02735 [Patescibacteria group bacterium]|nr:hypothetical protein [Patescibacteria group bacterium]MBU4023215.1 hypothetical protein [Patescibacteria group bacterium]MBU4078172.1 hypothetical protein [Patescibacteria group bacterium]